MGTGRKGLLDVDSLFVGCSSSSIVVDFGGGVIGGGGGWFFKEIKEGGGELSTSDGAAVAESHFCFYNFEIISSVACSLAERKRARSFVSK